MMNKELIELQEGCKSTGVVILNENCNELENRFVMDASANDNDLFARPLNNPIFKEDLENISEKENLAYFVISGIDKINTEMQNRYVGLVKDREFMGYKIPENIIIVFTIENKEGLKKISNELYHLCVVAF